MYEICRNAAPTGFAALLLMLGNQMAFGEILLDRKYAFDPYPLEVETLYMERLYAYRLGPAEGEVRGGLVQYDPLAQVAGASEWRPLPHAGTDDRGIPEAVLEEARKYAAEMNSSALMIWHGGALVEESYFSSNDRETRLISRSLAKPISALAVGRAVREGYIESLDQPVADFVEEWRVGARSEVLVRHLLDMRAGLLAQGFSDNPLSIFNLAYLHPHHEDILLHHYPLAYRPGTRYEYSNATSDMVAVLIERATGVRYHDWVSDKVLAPIGAPGGSIWLNRDDGVAHAGCCILLPAEAWLRMAILLLQEGEWEGERILDGAFVREVQQGTPENPHAGLGVFIAGPYVERRGSFHPEVDRGRSLHSEPYLAADLYLFDGYGSQVVYIVPSYDLVILRTGDSPPTDDREWDNAFLPNLLMRAIEVTPRPAAQTR